MQGEFKYPSSEALGGIDGPLASELGIHRFDAPGRSKAQLFSVGGPLGRKFAILLGNTDVSSGYHPAKQTRLLFERCELPSLFGVEVCAEPYQGSRIKNQQDSRLAAPNRVSCLVSNETALRAILRWYAGTSRGAGAAASLEQTRIAKAAADAGFDLTPDWQENWTVFRSTDFSAWVGVAVQDSGTYRLGVSDAVIGHRLCVELDLAPSTESGPWAMRVDAIEGYALKRRCETRSVCMKIMLLKKRQCWQTCAG